MSDRCWKLRPSDFAFLWRECRRCFYLKIVSGFPRPRAVMPKIFTVIDAQMKTAFQQQRTETISPDMPKGLVEFVERPVESRPFTVQLPDTMATCLIRGRLDTVVRFDDGTYGVVDFKTSERNAEHIPLYALQLQAYAHALEDPAPGKLALSPVTRLGLLVFEPAAFEAGGAGRAGLGGNLHWIEVARDEQAFFGFLAEVLWVLEQPSPPGGAPMCEWCQYRDTSRRTAL
ncbi:MAG: PD-(D/E)XK nuclease family protein [Candidatus Rokubacteria bacterium]|nr:PD-(D/E)XK nuclease family protein [Candidatus Rokubacteria bacterium]